MLEFIPYVSPSRREARVELALNGRWLERLTFRGAPPPRHGLFIDASTLDPDRVVDVVITPLDPRRPVTIRACSVYA